MHLPKLTTICLLFLLLNPNVQGQNTGGKLMGVVVNEHGLPIPGLHIMIESTHLGTITDAMGRFSISGIAPGVYTVVLNHIAYQTQRLHRILITAETAQNLDRVAMKDRILTAPKVVVTATRVQRESVQVPNAVNLLPQLSIKEKNVKSLSEALREEPGIAVQKTSHGGGSPIIRGLSSNQILMLVDGIRLNNATYRLGNHPYLTTVDYHMIQQMEVVRGPTSVLYGSDALGGTINALTRLPDWSEQGSIFHYRFLTRLATADQEKSARADFDWSGTRVAALGGISVKNFGDLKRGQHGENPAFQRTDDAVQHPSAFKALDADLKMIVRIDKKQSLIAAAQMTRRPEIPRYDKYENNGYTQWLYTDQNRDLAYLRYQNHPGTKHLSSFHATLSMHRQTEGRRIQKKPASDISTEKDRVQTLGLTAQANGRFGKHGITLGFDAYLDHVNSRASLGKIALERGRYPDGSAYNSYGLYLQDEMTLHSALTLIAGMRFSRFQTRFDDWSQTSSDVLRQHFQNMTGSLGLVARLCEGFYLNANLAQAFRAPNLSDLTKLGESQGEIWDVPNADLTAEHLVSMDLGVKIDLPRFQMDASVYQATIDDIISSADAFYLGASVYHFNGLEYQVKSMQNTGKALIRGIEADLRAQIWHHLWFRSYITIVSGENTTLDEPLSKLPPAMAFLGCRWQTKKGTAELFTRLASRQDHLSSEDLDDPRIPAGGTPAWHTLNIRASFQAAAALRIQASVENILDLNYREHASGINAPGINFIIALEYAK